MTLLIKNGEIRDFFFIYFEKRFIGWNGSSCKNIIKCVESLLYLEENVMDQTLIIVFVSGCKT